MGLVIIPVAFAIAVAWLGAAILVCVLVRALVRPLPFGKLMQFPAYALVLILAWYLPNANALKEQKRMDAVARQCGWTINRTVEGVNGVFVESPMGEDQWRRMAGIYPSVEHQIEIGRAHV